MQITDIITYVMIAAAGAYFVVRDVRARKGKASCACGCGSGCSRGCPCGCNCKCCNCSNCDCSNCGCKSR